MEKLLSSLIKKYPQFEFWLDVHEDNVRALGVYKKLGFVASGCREKYYKDGGAAVLMTLKPKQSQLF